MHLDHDIDGEKRIVRNVIFSWTSYVVYIIGGFLLPRLVADSLGQEKLGVWDFCWSLTSFFGLVQAPIGSSIERYVAKYWRANDLVKLAKSVSTVWLYQVTAATAILIIVYIVFTQCDSWFSEKLSEDADTAKYTLSIISVGIALEIYFNAFTGILNGLHNWHIHNLLNASTYVLSTVAMAFGLILFSAKLEHLAFVHVGGVLINQMARVYIVRSKYPDIRISLLLFDRHVLLEQFAYGVKSVLPRLSELFKNQLVNVLLVSALGPATLAVFVRPISLTRHLRTMVSKLSNILLPTVSSLQEASRHARISRLLLRSSFLVSAFAFPVIVILVVLGDLLIQVWMGPEFVDKSLVRILAFGSFFTIMQEPIWSIMAGLNLHGRIAVMRLIASALAVSLVWVGLFAAHPALWQLASLVVAPFVIVDGLLVPVWSCRRLGISIHRYYRRSIIIPVFLFLPSAIIICVARVVFDQGNVLAAAILIGASVVIGMIIYWLYVIPCSLKDRVQNALATLW